MFRIAFLAMIFSISFYELWRARATILLSITLYSNVSVKIKSWSLHIAWFLHGWSPEHKSTWKYPVDINRTPTPLITRHALKVDVSTNDVTALAHRFHLHWLTIFTALAKSPDTLSQSLSYVNELGRIPSFPGYFRSATMRSFESCIRKLRHTREELRQQSEEAVLFQRTEEGRAIEQRKWQSASDTCFCSIRSMRRFEALTSFSANLSAARVRPAHLTG